MNTYTLHGYFRSSTSWRVRIALGFKGGSFETVPVHLLRDGGQQHSESYRELNPVGEVPTLEVRGPDGALVARLAQSVAILEYLEETHPEPPLLPADPLQRAKTRQLVEVVSGGAIQSALSPLDSELALAGPHFFEGWSTMASDLFNVAAVATFGLAGSYITADRAGAPPSSPSGGRRRRRNADRALQAWDDRWDGYD